MGRDLTKRYVDEVLEVSGVKRKGADRIREIIKMSGQEATRLLDDIASRAANHYSRNFRSILEDLQGMEGCLKAYYFGSQFPLELGHAPEDWFIRKSALYYNKIVTIEQLEPPDIMWKPAKLKNVLVRNLLSLSILWPWIAEGIVEMIPSLFSMKHDLVDTIDRYGTEDFQDNKGWRRHALRHEDLQLEGEAYLRYLENNIREDYTSIFIEKFGAYLRTLGKSEGLRSVALYSAVYGGSAHMGEGFFGSWLTGSSPTTDLMHSWRLFGYWVSRRAEHMIPQELGRDRWESFVRKVKTGRAWLALDARELGVLSKLPPKKIIEIRDSADYSFRSFREDLGYAVDEIQGLELDDEEAYREAANQVWSKVRDSAREVKKDSDRLRKSIKLGAGVLAMSLILGLLPFDIAKVATALIGTPTALDIAKEYLELRELKKSTGYFLIRLEDFT